MTLLTDLSAPSLDTLTPDDVHVWCAPVPTVDDAALQARQAALMAPDEHAQHRRFMFDKDKRRFLTTRALVRTVLSRYAAVAPADWVFEANEWGRPAIVSAQTDAQRLQFNVSHTDGLVVLAITTGREIGVDTESAARRAPLDVADRFFSARESAALRALPADAREARFWDLWTFKESYIKARGMGLSLPLDGFTFALPDDRSVGISFEPGIDDRADRWQFWQFQPDATHLVAVCLERREAAPAFTFRTIEPMRSIGPLTCLPLREPAV